MITGLRPNGTPKDKFDWLRVVATYNLTPTAGSVAMVMFSNADPDGTRIWGSQKNLAKLINRSVISVKRAQAELRELGLIDRKRKGSGRSGMSSNYELVIPVGIGISIDTCLDDDENNRYQNCPKQVSELTEIGIKNDPPINPIINPTIKVPKEPVRQVPTDAATNVAAETVPFDGTPNPLIGVKTDPYSFTTTTNGSSPGDRDICVSIGSLRNGERLEAERKLFAELPALASLLGPAVTGLPLDVHRKFMADLITEGRIFHDQDTNKVYEVKGV